MYEHQTWKDITPQHIARQGWSLRVLWHAQRLLDENKDERRAFAKAHPGEPQQVERLDANVAYRQACRLVQNEMEVQQELNL